MAGRDGASDERGGLTADPFDYHVTKQGGVVVSRGGRAVLTVGGRSAAQFVAVLQRADDFQVQHLLARAAATLVEATNGRRPVGMA